MMILSDRLYDSIRRRRAEVFTRADFPKLQAQTGYDQIGRALNELVARRELIRVGKGLYAKATASPLARGAVVPRVGIRRIAEESLTKLGVRVFPTRAEQEYQAGRTTQVPAGRVVAVDKRVRRKIGYNGIYVGFERASSR